MTDESKTHYRKAFDSPYLGAADVVDPIVLTIKRVALEIDKTKKTKDLFNTAYFAEREIRQGERLKPMILNATNSKKLAEIAGSKFIDDWINVPVTIYVDPNVSFGREKVEGLRIAKASERKERGPSADDFIKQCAGTKTDADASALWKDGAKSLAGDGDKAGYDRLKKFVIAHRKAIADQQTRTRAQEAEVAVEQAGAKQ